MLVTQAIFTSIGIAFPDVSRLDVPSEVAFDFHLQIDTDAPVEQGRRAEDVHICHSDFDDLGNRLAGLGVCGDSHFRDCPSVTRIDLVLDRFR